MRKPSRTSGAWFIGTLLVASATGCSTSYWSSLTSTSIVNASVTTPGNITWTRALDSLGRVISATYTSTAPSLSLILTPDSAPVTFSNAEAVFYDTPAAANSSGNVTRNPLVDLDGNMIPPLYFPFLAQLSIPNRSTAPTAQTVTLDGVINQSLIDLTNPASTSSIAITTILADVTLSGKNSMGQAVNTDVEVPINVVMN